jgi:hypothetical protein
MLYSLSLGKFARVANFQASLQVTRCLKHLESHLMWNMANKDGMPMADCQAVGAEPKGNANNRASLLKH